MCGLAGCISFGKEVNKDVLVCMTDIMGHRGPDGSGVWVSDCGRVGLGHRRLSIIDLSDAAAQPMHDEQGRACIVFNGEIYNHRSLREELERDGAQFYTDHSDTETLLQGYIVWGIKRLLDRLIGMFAFAIFDQKKKKIILVRDRLGIKPLYIAKINGGIIFASEAKALLEHPDVQARLNYEYFYHYLSFRSVPAPATLFDGIQKLAAGELIEIDITAQAMERISYWNPLEIGSATPQSLEEAEERVEELLASSLRYRLEADVPIGVFLSGGVDSAYLLRLAASQLGDVNTYTITYPEDPKYDEGGEARKLAQEVGAHHHEVPIRHESFIQNLAAIAYYQDEPIAAPVCIPVYLLAREARRTGVPVVLSGEGSDELFIGYENWLRIRDLQRLDHYIPDFPGRAMRRAVASLAQYILSPISRYPEFLGRAAKGQPLFWGGAMDFTERGKEYLIGSAVPKSGLDTFDAVVRPIREEFLRHRPGSDITGWMSFMDVRFRLPELMLPRLDKMCMAFSVEGRVPFLDHRLVEMVMNLPEQFRSARGNEGKLLFKSVASRVLPEEFVYRRKRGFQAPVKEWKNTEFGRRYLPSLIKFAARSELFNPDALKYLLGQAGDRLYFSLLNFMMWYLVFIENIMVDDFPDLDGRPWLSVSQ